MKYIKRIAVILLIALISICAVFYSYYGIKNGAVVFAEDNINFMSDAELEAAYQAYLQSRGGGYLGNAGARLAYTNGKMLNFLTSESNTTPYKNINEIKGLMSWQKAELESGNSSILQLVMSQGGASVFSLYTQWLLQNHYFGNGVDDDYNNTGMFESGSENTLYNGALFTDLDGFSCLIYKTNTAHNNTQLLTNATAIGTQYVYNGKELYSKVSGGTTNIRTFNFNQSNTNKVLNGKSAYASGSWHYQVYFTSGRNGTLKNDDNTYLTVLMTSDNYVDVVYFNGTRFEGLYTLTQNNSNDNVVQNANIIFYTNNNINITDYPDIDVDGTLRITPKVKIDGGDTYEYYTVNEGDNITNIVNNYYNDSGTKDKTIALPDDGKNTTPPSGGTLPNWNNPWPNLSSDGEGGFNFNFTLPDLNIDWNINGLTEKFPFSIPFDFIAFCRVLNAEPQTPEWSGTLTLPMVNYPFTFSLQQFDNVATILRNMEFIGFCIALILATRALIKG